MKRFPVRRWLVLASLTLSIAPLVRAQSSISVLNYGAQADGIMRTDGAVAAGSQVLTSPSGSFASGDVGKYIQVIGAGSGGTSRSDGAMQAGSTVLNSPSGIFAFTDVGRGMVVLGAGAGGGNLVTTIQGYNSPTSVSLANAAQTVVTQSTYYYGAMTMEGTIQSVQSSTAVTLSNPAAATITGATFAYGTDNHSAFQAALDATGQAGGGIVSVPSPSSCPGGAVCGYVVRVTDQMTATAPGAVKIRYNNLSLEGDASQPNLFCRGAWADYLNSVAFPGQLAEIRGSCINIGDNGGPNGTAGTAVSNITISNLHLYGMTNGNTYNNSFGQTNAPMTTTGDGWDETHKGIYMWANSVFSNITIESTFIQNFKGENIFSGGSTLTGMVISNCTITNYNSDGISMLAADLQVINNTISNGSNAAVENSTVGGGNAALRRQLYQNNTISQMAEEGIVVVGVDQNVALGSLQIVDNYFDTIAIVHPNGAETAIYVATQGGNVPPGNVTISGNTCHDCYTFANVQNSGSATISGNTIIVDKASPWAFLTFMNPLSNLTIANNTGYATSNAQANGLHMAAVYMLNPGWASGNFNWNNVVIGGNSWTFSGTPEYQFNTTGGGGWNLVTGYNLIWQGDTCAGCTHADANHGLLNLSAGSKIIPYGPVVYVNGNSAPITATIDASKEQNGSQVQIVNAGSSAVTFAADTNLSLSGPVTLPGGSASSATFLYNATLGKFTLGTASGQSILASAGTPQSATVNTPFGTALQATVTSGGTPVSGATVTFTAPNSGASGTFGGSVTATATTNASGVATAPGMTANGQTGSYSVTASTAGVTTPASFSLTNTASSTGGGSLQGSGTSATTSVNLTAEGTADWVHWGDGTLNRKAGVTPQLSTYTIVGTGAVSTYNNDLRAMNWTDGTPTASSSNNMNGVYLSGVGQGFSIVAPADTTVRTLTMHVGGWYSGGTLTASLSDGSALNYLDVTAVISGQYDRNYTLIYKADSAGQTLTVTWEMTSGTGNVTLNGVALQGGSSGTETVAATAGTPQSAAVNAVFGTALQATVTSGGNPVNGVTVTFTAPGSGSGGTFGGSSTATATTNASGVATAPALTANSQAGSYSVTASVAGVPASVSFGLTNTAAVPASIVASAGAPQSAAVSKTFGTALQATVKDGGGNPVNGVTVTFTAPSSGSGGTFGGSSTATATTNANGVATAPALTANSQAGSYSVTAGVAGVSASASFGLTNTPAVAVSIVPSAGTPQSATVSTAFGTTLQVTVTSGGTPVSGTSVTFTAPGSGASGTFGGSAAATATTNASGVAAAPALTANSQTGSYSVTASVAGAATPASFSLTNTAAPTSTGGGSLQGSGTSATTAVNLTVEGTMDWVHWGDSTLNRKAGVTPQLSTYTIVGTGAVLTYNNDPRAMSWTDGTPTATSSDNRNGVYIRDVGQGFSLTAPADTTLRTLVIHVGGWSSGGTLTAHLSDGSAADFTDLTVAVPTQYDRTYTLTYQAGTGGQNLTVTWKMTSGNGNVVLDAAALQ